MGRARDGVVTVWGFVVFWAGVEVRGDGEKAGLGELDGIDDGSGSRETWRRKLSGFDGVAGEWDDESAYGEGSEMLLEVCRRYAATFCRASSTTEDVGLLADALCD